MTARRLLGRPSPLSLQPWRAKACAGSQGHVAQSWILHPQACTGRPSDEYSNTIETARGLATNRRVVRPHPDTTIRVLSVRHFRPGFVLVVAPWHACGRCVHVGLPDSYRGIPGREKRFSSSAPAAAVPRASSASRNLSVSPASGPNPRSSPHMPGALLRLRRRSRRTWSSGESSSDN